MKITAIIPMRHDSERIKGKNYREFLGKPLYHYIVNTLKECQAIHDIVIDTDSPTIMDDAMDFFPDVRVFERPNKLRAGEIPMYEVLKNTVSKLDGQKFFLQTHSTNPLLTHKTIQKAVQFYNDNYPLHDSIFSVTKLQTRLWNHKHLPMNHDPNQLMRTQDLQPIFEENSCFYLFDRETILNHNNRIGQRPYLMTIPKEEAIDIDEESDFIMAEMMYKYYHKL